MLFHTIGKKREIIQLGNLKSYNIKELYPKLYDKLTVSNFLLEVKSSSFSGESYHNNSPWYDLIISGSFSVSKSYNADTGILSITASISGKGDSYQSSTHSSSYNHMSCSYSGNCTTMTYLVLPQSVKY